MSETWTEQSRRRAREREERRKRRKKRKKSPLDPDEWLKAGRREIRRRLRRLTRAQQRKVRSSMRKRQRQIRKSVFGQCPVCGQAGGPGHRCRVRFSRHNEQLMRRRLARQGGLPTNRQDPDLWKHQIP